MKAIPLLLIISLTLGFMAVACGSSNTSIESAGITKEKLIDGLMVSRIDIKTGQAEGNDVFTAEGSHGTLTMRADYKCIFDWSQSQMKLNQSRTINFNGYVEIYNNTIYVFGTMAYILIQDEGLPDLWIYGELPESYWSRWETVDQEIELLYSSKINILPMEEVAGTPCYVAEIIPDMDTLQEILNSAPLPSLPEESPQSTVDRFIFKRWFAQDNFFTLKIHDEFDSTYPDGKTFHDVQDYTYHDYNKNVSIQLPPEAKKAQYVGALDKFLEQGLDSVTY